MAVDLLSDELKNAGASMTAELDAIGLVPQGALWMHSHILQDWRFCVVSDLVGTLARPVVYDLIGKALDKIGPVDGLTIFDVHLFEPDEIVPTVLGGAFRVDGISCVSLIDCIVNGLTVDALVYRLVPPREAKERARAAKAFERRVKALT